MQPRTRYTPLPTAFYRKNRDKLASLLPPNAIAILHASDVMPKDGDSIMGFWQDSDLLYLSGIDQEETILLLYPDAKDPAHRAILFLKETSPEIAIWEGEKYSQEGARDRAGIDTVHWLEAFPRLLHRLLGEADALYLNANEHPRATTEVESRSQRFVRWCQARYPLHCYGRLAPLLRQLRAVKEEVEIEALRTACEITRRGFLDMLRCVRPGVMEYELEAELLRTFIKNRSRGFAYAPIIGSGPRACILHYVANSQACAAGELILADVGAEYAGYSADLTRTIPVDGRFTPRQRAVYCSVLHVMKEAKKLLKPGTTIPAYHEAVGSIMEEELRKLGLLTAQEIRDQDPRCSAYKRYFMHGTSHHLGLNTHDVADLYRPLAPGMVFTVEPGIYIREEGIGIRLENNIVVRAEGPEDLMEAIPLEPEAIEAAMQGAGDSW